jgi:hypothetical protein
VASERMSVAAEAVHGKYYEPRPATGLYPTCGTARDYFYHISKGARAPPATPLRICTLPQMGRGVYCTASLGYHFGTIPVHGLV